MGAFGRFAAGVGTGAYNSGVDAVKIGVAAAIAAGSGNLPLAGLVTRLGDGMKAPSSSSPDGKAGETFAVIASVLAPVAVAAVSAVGAAEAGVTVTEEGLATVAEHLAQFGEHAPNTAMLDRLAGQVGSAVTGADANFYTHELLEAGHMASGMSYEAAHAAALEQAAVSPYSIYHPEVIQQFPAQFNNAWRAFWGL